MSTWLEPLRQVLDRAPQAIGFFFRDDDAGWQDAKLYRLLDMFAAHRIPIDVAVIPQSLNEPLAENLQRRLQIAPGRLGLHQHGYKHINHEPQGRKYEFGPNRTSDQQRCDLLDGQARLETLLGPILDPIFTPPWNRCTATTVACLASLGYRILSRDATATPLPLPPGLTEQPVSIDWFRQRQGLRVGRQAIGQQLAEAVQNRRTVGVMLHHAVMDKQDLEDIRNLLVLLANHHRAHCQLMRDSI